MNDELYGRVCYLRVYQPITTQITDADGGIGILINGYETNYQEYRSEQLDGSPGFRIRFNCQKTLSLSPNHGTISIYNLNQDSRDRFSKRMNLVELYAGYGANAKLIFKGNLARGRTVKVGSDYITNVEVQDGLYANQFSRIDQSYNPGIQKNAVIKDMTTAVAALPGMSMGEVRTLNNDGYNFGLVLSGGAMDKLKEVCDGENLYFFIEDHKVYVIPVGEAKSTPPVKLSPNTGLVGIPERGNDKMTLKCLLNPELTLAQRIILTSKFVNGIFLTSTVTNVGDTFGAEWYSNIDCAYPGSDEAAF